VPLRTEAGIDGEPCSFHEITEIVVDEELTDGLFPFTSPCGVPGVLISRPGVRLQPSIEEAARRSSFTALPASEGVISMSRRCGQRPEDGVPSKGGAHLATARLHTHRLPIGDIT